MFLGLIIIISKKKIKKKGLIISQLFFIFLLLYIYLNVILLIEEFYLYLHPVKVYAYDKEIYKDWNSHFDELTCCKYIHIVQQKSRP